MSEQNRSESTTQVSLLADDLMRLTNVSDQRKGRDLKLLVQISMGLWKNQLSALSVSVGEWHSLLLSAQLQVAGILWDGQPVLHNDWGVQISIPRYYPMAQPEVRFVSPAPYNPHVLHQNFLPDEQELPPDLRPFLEAIRSGAGGGCCYLRQWKADLTYDLRLVVWQLSRILCGACFHGESNSLNNHARDHFLRLEEQGKLPMDAALPIWVDQQAVADIDEIHLSQSVDGEAGRDDDVSWDVGEGDQR